MTPFDVSITISILKESFKGMVPEGIRNRAKQPYRAPIKESFLTDEAGGYITELLSEKAIRSAGYFDAKKVSLLCKRFSAQAKQAASEVQNMALVGILSTQILHQQFVENFDPESFERVVPERVIRNYG